MELSAFILYNFVFPKVLEILTISDFSNFEKYLKRVAFEIPTSSMICFLE